MNKVAPPRTDLNADPSAPPPCGANVAAFAKNPAVIARLTGAESFPAEDTTSPTLRTCLASCALMSDALTSARCESMFLSANDLARPPPCVPPALHHAVCTFSAVTASPSATANLSLVKARMQFGIPAITHGLVALYAASALLQLLWPGFATAVINRGMCGLAAAALTTFTTEAENQGIRPYLLR